MTRNGKIARISRCIRDELNQRLADGEQGKSLVEWLNEHPDVKEVLDLYFDGRPITEQNLSEWKQGGHQDWLRHQETLELLRTAAEEGEELQDVEDLNGENGVAPLSDRVSPVAVAVLMKLLRAATASEAPDTPESRREVLAVIRELTALRVSDHRAARLKMDLRRWKEERAKLESDALHREVWERIKEMQLFRSREEYVQMITTGMTPEQEQRLREYLGMGPRLRPGNGVPLEAANGGPPPGQSGSIQVNPTESDHFSPPGMYENGT